jgi:restriction endonuclease S subunit
VGKINLGIDCAIGRSVAAIRPKNVLLQKYLYYFLELKMLEIRGQSKGSAQGVITKDYINSIQIPLPELKVQQDILDSLESNFSQLEKSIDKQRLVVIPPSQRERESTTSLSSLTREREREQRECAPYYLYGLNRNINRGLALTASAYGSPAE